MTSFADAGAGTLRDAITQANTAAGSDTIVFDTTVFGTTPRTISLASALPSITGDTIINGPGENFLTVNRATGAPTFRIFTFTGANLTMSKMTVTGGNQTQGGGLQARGTTVLDHMVFKANTSPGTGFGAAGGGVFMAGASSLTLTNSTVSGNTAGGNGGGIYFFSGGSLVVQNSTISGNNATSASAGRGGGGIYFFGTATQFMIQNSTISGNTSASSGGGIELYYFNGVVNIQNSTITGNNSAATTADYGGGGIGAIYYSYPAINIVSSVISGNTNANGADILNPLGTSVADHSAVGVQAGSGLPATPTAGNLAYGANLMLGALQNNGGPTFTHLPQAGSPLLNAGTNASSLTTDQRGVTFVRTFGTSTDIGAVEVQPSSIMSIAPSVPSPTNATDITFVVQFNQPQPSLIAANFALATTGGASGFIEIPVPVSGSNTTQYNVVVSNVFAPPAGGTIGLNLVTSPPAPNNILNNGTTVSAANTFVGQVITIDQKAPSAVSIVRASANPATGPVNFTVTFDEAVTNVTAANFSIIRAGSVAGGSITNIVPASGSSTTWTVTVSGYTGNGNLGLNLTSATGIKDVAGNTLSATNLPIVGQLYIVGLPVVTAVTAPVSATNASSVTYTVSFNQAVTGFSATNMELVTSGVTGASIGAITSQGTGDTWTVVVNTGTGEGTVQLNVVNGTGVTPTLAGAPDLPKNGTIVTIDHIGPTLVSLERFDPAGADTNAATLNFYVTFNEAVTGLTAANFTLTGTATGSVTIGDVTPVGDGTVWNVAVDVATGALGTIGLDLTSATAITDPATNAIETTNIPFTGEVYNVDRVAPTVTAITRQTPSTPNTNATSVDFLVTFSEAVTGGTVDDFDLVTTGTSTGASVTNVVAGPTPNTVIVTVNTGSTTGTIQLEFAGGGEITDLFVNDVANDGFTDANGIYNVDTIAPTVESITRVTDETTNLPQVQFTVTFSETVNALSVANLALTTTGSLAGTSIASVVPVGTAPTTTWTVTVNTGTGGGDLRLDVVSSTGLADGFTNAVSPLPFDTGESYIVDHAIPTVVSIDRALPNPTNSSGVTFTVTFSEPVTGVTTNNFSIVVAGAIVGASINSVTSDASGAVWTVSVLSGNGSGTIGLNLTSTANIKDLSDNPLQGTFTGQVYDIDKSQPSITSIARGSSNPTNATAILWHVTFNEAVLNVQSTNFRLTTAGLVTGASIQSVAPGAAPNIFDVIVSTGTGDGTIRLDLSSPNGITDIAGNPLTVTRDGEVYTIDKTAPTVTITQNITQPSPTYNQPIQFTVVFSEPVFGFAGSSVTFGGTANPTTATVTGSGNSYIVGIEGMTNSGTVFANLLAGVATDAAGNPSLAATGAIPSVDYLKPVESKNDIYSTPAQKPLTVSAAQGVLANDSPSSSGPLTVTLVAAPDPSTGTVVLKSDGSFVFTPKAGFSGAATFSYTATDGGSTSQPTLVTINVVPRTVRLAAGAGVGGGPAVAVYDVSGTMIARFFAYDPSFNGGVQVGTGDVNGDGVDDIVVGTGVGGGPNVKVFDGVTFAEIASFFAYEPSFRGGVQVAVGDIDGDGYADIIAGTGNGGGPRIVTFSGNGFALINNFFAYEPSFRGGVNVAVGDIDGDGKPEILASPGVGGGPRITAFDSSSLTEVRSFFAFDPSGRDGVSVAVGDVFNDGSPDIIVGPGVGSTVRAINGNDLSITAEIPDAFPVAHGGVRVAAKDTNNDSVNDQILIATGVGDPPRVYRFNLTTMSRVDELFGFPVDFTGGIYVG